MLRLLSMSPIRRPGRLTARACEHRLTVPRATVASARLALIAAAALAAAACGGGRGDTYAKAIDRQGACCEQLTAGRDACLAEIVRVDDPAAARAPANQDSYACVADHFVCDPATGRATAESNQRQLDCITDLGQ
jgi:hypothetical protein